MYTIIYKFMVSMILKISLLCSPRLQLFDVDMFVSSSDLEKFSITSLAQQSILCSEWVPSEWESK